MNFSISPLLIKGILTKHTDFLSQLFHSTNSSYYFKCIILGGVTTFRIYFQYFQLL